MEEIKTEPVDFVKEFQEYLSQQTQHVNMISGSVCGEKEAAEPYSSNVHGMWAYVRKHCHISNLQSHYAYPVAVTELRV